MISCVETIRLCDRLYDWATPMVLFHTKSNDDFATVLVKKQLFGVAACFLVASGLRIVYLDLLGLQMPFIPAGKETAR